MSKFDMNLIAALEGNWNLESIETTIPFVTSAAEMKHEELMNAIKGFLAVVEEDNMTDEEKLNLRMSIIDILAYCEYPEAYIQTMDEQIRLYMMNHKDNDINPGNPYAKFNPTKQNVSLRRGVFYAKYLANEVEEVDEVETGKPSLNIACKVGNVEGTIVRIGKGGATLVNTTKGRYLMHPDAVTVEDTKISDLILGDVPEYTEETTEDGEVAFHTRFGRVRIIDRTTDEYGHEVIEVMPISSLVFLEANNLKYSINDDEIGEGNRANVKFITCDPSELYFLSDLKPDIRTKVVDIMNGTVQPQKYQAFSCNELVSGSYMRDRQNKVLKGFEKSETTKPVSYGLEEDVYVLANLPREEVRGSRARLYAAEISKAYREAYTKAIVNGKLDRSKLKLPAVPAAAIKVEAVTATATVNGITSYKANVTDTFDTFRVKSAKGWKIQYKQPQVLVMGAETGRIFVTPAWWLVKTDIGSSVEVQVPKYKQVAELPKRPNRIPQTGTISTLIKSINNCFKVEKMVNVKLDLTIDNYDMNGRPIFTKPAHKKYFDVIANRKLLGYQYIDPRTNEAIETPEVFVYNPESEPEFGHGSDLVTATEYRRNTRRATEETTEVDQTAELIAQIKQLGINKVSCKVVAEGGVVDVIKGTANYSFQVVPAGVGYRVDTKLNISDKAKDLFVKLFKAVRG